MPNLEQDASKGCTVKDSVTVFFGRLARQSAGRNRHRSSASLFLQLSRPCSACARKSFNIPFPSFSGQGGTFQPSEVALFSTSGAGPVLGDVTLL